MSFSATTYHAIKIKVLVEALFQNVGELNYLSIMMELNHSQYLRIQPNSMLIFQRI